MEVDSAFLPVFSYAKIPEDNRARLIWKPAEMSGTTSKSQDTIHNTLSTAHRAFVANLINQQPETAPLIPVKHINQAPGPTSLKVPLFTSIGGSLFSFGVGLMITILGLAAGHLLFMVIGPAIMVAGFILSLVSNLRFKCRDEILTHVSVQVIARIMVKQAIRLAALQSATTNPGNGVEQGVQSSSHGFDSINAGSLTSGAQDDGRQVLDIVVKIGFKVLTNNGFTIRESCMLIRIGKPLV